MTQDGKAIKMLATASRLDIEDFLQKKVYLEVTSSSLCVVDVLLTISFCSSFFSQRSFKFLIAINDSLHS
jgi:hypothetical protein